MHAAETFGRQTCTTSLWEEFLWSLATANNESLIQATAQQIGHS